MIRYVTLTLPRTLAHLPYGDKGLSTDVFAYEELGARGW
ncbi:type VI secretion system contractile sheath large subunit [Vibrio lentus]|nr:type VI secretion system contractile sheath large subunit [Vibrio lentus]